MAETTHPTNNQAINQASSNLRRHDIDALRAIAFTLLILYHVGMFYVSWGWHVKSSYPAPWLEHLMLLLNQWRMPLIFVISGLAVNFLLGENGQQRLSYRALAWSRTKRLGLPLLFGMLVIVPPQAYYEALSNGVIERGYWAFLAQYFTFVQWPKDAFAGSDNGITWNHLWYLPYLLSYTLALIPIALLLDGRLASFRRAFQGLRRTWLILVPVLLLWPIGIWIFPKFPYIRHDLTSDWYAHAMYGSFFLFGFLIGRSPGVWRELKRLRWVSLPLALLTYLLFRGMILISPEEPGLWTSSGQTLVVYLNRWIWIVAALGWAHQLLNRPMRWLDYANRAVFPWYILHQTIIVAVGFELSQRQVGPVLEPVALILATVIGCAAGMYIIERWLPLLKPAMGINHRAGQIANFEPIDITKRSAQPL